MFDILVYLFENYYTPEACPEADVLAHKLAAVGFEHEDIDEALGWLYGLAQTTEQCVQMAEMSQGDSLRVFTDLEYQALGTQAIGFITFLENSGVLPPALREILIERAEATAFEILDHRCRTKHRHFVQTNLRNTEYSRGQNV